MSVLHKNKTRIVFLLTLLVIMSGVTYAGWWANRRAAQRRIRSQGRFGRVFPQMAERRMERIQDRRMRRATRVRGYSQASARSYSSCGGYSTPQSVGCGGYSQNNRGYQTQYATRIVHQPTQIVRSTPQSVTYTPKQQIAVQSESEPLYINGERVVPGSMRIVEKTENSGFTNEPAVILEEVPDVPEPIFTDINPYSDSSVNATVF